MYYRSAALHIAYYSGRRVNCYCVALLRCVALHMCACIALPALLLSVMLMLIVFRRIAFPPARCAVHMGGHCMLHMYIIAARLQALLRIVVTCCTYYAVLVSCGPTQAKRNITYYACRTFALRSCSICEAIAYPHTVWLYCSALRSCVQLRYLRSALRLKN